MSFADEYFKLRNKRLGITESKAESKTGTSKKKTFEEEYFELKAQREAGGNNPPSEVIAPVYQGLVPFARDGFDVVLYGQLNGIQPTTKATPKKDDGEKWYQGYLQLGDALSDGYQFGDVTKTLIGTDAGILTNALSGVVGWGEKAVDAVGTALGIVAEKAGNDERTEKLRGLVTKDLYDEKEVTRKLLKSNILGTLVPQANSLNFATSAIFTIDDWLNSKEEDNSVFGDKANSLMQSTGETLVKKGIQMSAGGIPVGDIITGITVYGGQAEQALKEGATFGEATGSGLISAGAEIMSEKLSGGIKIGGVALDDGLTRIVAKNISNVALANAVNFGIGVAGESLEEVATEFVSKLGTKLYKEEDLGEILFSKESLQDYIQAAIGGGLMGGAFGAVEGVSATKEGKNYRTGLTANEQKVLDKEIENRIAEEEQDGKKLSAKEKSKIYESVLSDMAKGYISTDTIEEALGGESYKTYKDTIDSEDAQIKSLQDQLKAVGESADNVVNNRKYDELQSQLEDLKKNSQRNQLKTKLGSEVFGLVKGDRLVESYNERYRRGEAYQADLSQYDEAQRAVIQKAIDSKILNNTNRTHEFVDMIAKISADKGVLFDFTNNERLKESGFAIDGKQVNGFVTKDGVTLNINAAKSLNKVVGHEITHVLEGTDLYTELQSIITEYAKSKGEYQTRYDNLAELYKNVKDADIDAELTADLVGDYLFTDTDFIKTLSVQHRNVFQKIYDEVKYLCKVATAGSKEARELEKVKKTFDQVYREKGKVSKDAKYSLSQNESIANGQDLWYNANRGEEYVRTDEFRNLQAESQRMSAEEWNFYLRGGENEVVRRRVSTVLQRQMDTWRSSGGTHNGVLRLSGKDNQFNIYEGVNPSLFHDVFEVTRKYLQNGELVDLHEVETTEDHGIGYKYCNNYLSEDGLSGFSITPDGDLISVFNASGKGGFLRAISDTVKAKAKTLDCYASPNQNLMEMYQRVFGFKAASVMDYNMEYDHDNIAENHDHPKVAFMVNTENDVETRAFTEEQYDEAVAYRDSFLNQATYSLSEGEKIINTLTGREIDGNTYAVLDRLNRGDVVAPEELANLKEVQEGNEKMDDLVQEFIAEHPELKDVPTKDIGTYLLNSEERVNLRNEIISERMRDGSFTGIDKNRDEVYNGNVRKDKRLDIVIGLPASGKSSSIVNPLSQFYQSVVIDSDIIKKMLPEFNDGWGASLVHEESSIVNTDLLVETLKAGSNIVLPVVGKKTSSVEKYIDLAKERGYSVNVHLNELPNGKAVGRMLKRYFDDGRFIDPGYALGCGDKPTEVYEQIKQRSDISGYSRWNNDVAKGQRPTPTEVSENNRVYSQCSGAWRASRGSDIGQSDSRGTGGETQVNEIAPIKETSSEDGVFFDAQNRRSLSEIGETPVRHNRNDVLGEDIALQAVPEVAPVAETVPETTATEQNVQKSEDAQKTDARKAAELRLAESEELRELGITPEYDKLQEQCDRTGIATGANSLGQKYTITKKSNGKYVVYVEGEDSGGYVENVLEAEVNSFEEAYLTAQEYFLEQDPDTVSAILKDYSTPAAQELFPDDLAPMSEDGEQERLASLNDADAPVGDIAPVAETPAQEAYEAIRPKREPSKEPRMVRADSKGKQRKWVKTSTKSDAVDGKVLPKDLNQDLIHYQPIPNKKTLGNANAKLNSMGYEASISYLNSQFSNNKVTLDDIALGERLIQEAVKRGDTKTAGDLIMDISILGTELGQKVQALSIIKRLTPEGQLRMLQRTVERGKTKGDKAFEGVKVTQGMKDKILKTYRKDGTYDQKKLNKVVEDVKQELAAQMKVSGMEKVNAWRYLSMLGNPKTHIRNLVSNVAMRGTVAVKNAVARTIESIAPIENRTKTWKPASKDVKKFAQQTAVEMKDIISGDSKYSEAASIKAKRAIFKNKILNGVYEFNSDMLSKEDWWFSKPAFTNALSEYLTANGVYTEADIEKNPKIVEKAKQYALEQSQIATFRQYSWLSNKINEIERKNAATQIAVGSVLPFKKTPINIAKTGLNYSPLGFAKTLTYDISQVKKGNMEASELIDHLAQNITGSALTLVGYMLASSGFLNGAGDDDKEGDYDYQLGRQAYSINIGDDTFSLSWLSPVAMPLFVGANAYEQLVEGKEWNGDVVIETLAQTLDPLSEMSFISSLDSVLSSYDSGMQKFAGIFETAAQNYVTQFAPTLMSQVATVMDDTKRSTKVAGDSNFKFVDETINKLKYKIPFLRETLEPTTDIWGNEVKQTENFITRGFETFLAPYAKREDITTGIDEEIKSLYSETGDTGLIPSIPYNYINYDGVKYEMSAEEFTEYKKRYGQTAYDMLEDLFATNTYKSADSETRAEMVNMVYDYARDSAKKNYFDNLGVKYTNATSDGTEVFKENAIRGAIENDMPVDEYKFYTKDPDKYKFFRANGVSYSEYANGSEDFKEAWSWAYNNPDSYTFAKAVSDDLMEYRQYSGDLYDIKADKDEYGKSISGSRKEKVLDYINNMDADYYTKIILWKNEYPSDDTYNYEIIDYLNSREDISFEDMVTILRKLDFNVDDEGNIWW